MFEKDVYCLLKIIKTARVVMNAVFVNIEFGEYIIVYVKRNVVRST